MGGSTNPVAQLTLPNYLGTNVSKQGGGGGDIVNRIRQAMVSFMNLRQIAF